MALPTGPVTLTVPTDDIQPPANPPAPTLDVPAGASQKTVGGAEDFVKWWFGLPVAAINRGSTQVIRAYSAPACGECDRLISETEESIRERWSARPAENPAVVILDSIVAQDLATISLVGFAPATDYLDASGAVVETDTAYSVTAAVDVVWTGTQWQVAQVRGVE
ncbi:DUF6318 family protein [Nakamurella leprariae]|uniref:DUF6318 domain-containing protein n=1 Tax=Nakamurella leprariae TaxID=2803911 RepID=A0A938YHA6_9ACTN|nr:DUF6318 family protein [Nakamurella leprariae]MBM9468104.1 hypothetical protein [Nakamurella leprariae]